MAFVHLHVHTQYSILDGAAAIPKLFEKAEEDGQTALAITDHGNMYGVKEFFKYADKHPDVKPIIGSEVYVARGRMTEKRGKEDQSSFHLILLAKNLQGYHNLVKLSSYAFIDGFYYRPRIDHELLEKYHEGLICSSACIAGEVQRSIYANDLQKAEEQILWYKNLFGEDYYLEVQRHETQIPGADKSVFIRQQIVNEGIFQLAAKHNVKVIATNDVHFVNAEDGPAHDRLICLTTNENYDEPKRLRYTQQEYLKTQQQMAEVFSDHPEVISNTLEVAEKVERYSIDSKPILPRFDIPAEFKDSDDYLRHLTYVGAAKRYGDNLTDEIKERIEFELSTIKRMGFPDYFLIVQDFIIEARKEGVWVGPGRGSAAGSVVAYCLTITNMDPIKYDLLFERFLNPDRISMPDIDIDFDDDGRYDIFKYVERKYGKDHISHVVTFGTMAARSAVKDIARIHQIPLDEADRFAKMIPTRPFDVAGKKKPVPVSIENCIQYIPEIKDVYENSSQLFKDTVKYASQLEGNIRQTGVHACATIIGREDLTNFIPICTAKDKDTGEDMLVSQYEGSYIEDVGMLKMDFLGLKTLSILKECVSNIRKSTGKVIDVDQIPLEDEETFKLFSSGDTVAVFQFESPGMQKWLRMLKPTRFVDLIAMNALYRPGPMDYIPDFVERKQGRMAIKYDLPEMEEYLKDTYGVTVYQEQVMRISQKIAGFTPGEADKLRKAMGKKKAEEMAKLYDKFIAGGTANGHKPEILEKIWTDWTAFASYAFNKSHSTCYAWIGYQTAWLKTHYPAEFMAANLSRSLNDVKEITKLMSDCRKSKIEVLGPDVNESLTTFAVNKKGNIRFGLAGIKGVGANVIDLLITTREKGGPFTDIFDFVERVPLLALNRKVMECLVYAGAFDGFREMTRPQYFVSTTKDETFIDELLRYANKFQNDTLAQVNNLFGDSSEMKPVRPDYPSPVEANDIELLKKEKELVGMYLSAHPLDRFRFEIEHFTTNTLQDIDEVESKLDTDSRMVNEGKKRIEDSVLNKALIVSGLVTQVDIRYTKSTNKPWCKFTVEDFSGSHSFSLFGKDYEVFMKYTQLNTALLVKCVTEKRFQKQDDPNPPSYALKCKGMTLLSNVKEDLVKEFHIVMPIEILNDSFRSDFKKVLKRNKGNSRLFLEIVDKKQKLSAEFFSKSIHISPDTELLEWLEANGLKYVVPKVKL